MKNSYLIALMGIVLVLTGCENSETIDKKKNPQVGEEIVVEGCSVKFVDRGYPSESFFIAKCGSTTTTTSNYMSGKVGSRMTAITYEIDKLQKEKSELENDLKVENNSLSNQIIKASNNKLTAEEAIDLITIVAGQMMNSTNAGSKKIMSANSKLNKEEAANIFNVISVRLFSKKQ